MATEITAPIAMLHDVSKCSGCRACMVACKQWKDLPADPTPFDGQFQSHKELSPKTYNLLIMKEYYRHGRLDWNFLKYQCMHCGDATCIKACPSKALYKSDSGAVLLDEAKCVGCGYCEAYCQYQVPKIDKERKKSTKCNFCIDRVENGMEPSCSKICVTDCISFGSLEDMQAKAEARLLVLKKDFPMANLYNVRPNNGILGANMMYILTDAPATYGLLEDPKIPLSITLTGGAVPEVPEGGLGAKVSPVHTAFAGVVVGAAVGAGVVLSSKLSKETIDE
ncbi:MAG: 4Fe-4S dicluster domain-containing protein [Deferribacteraceae bacterium]|jgi:formate dehydrogenase iron-sulfur subunit|nr:4Fe-4S dicluster domain-containing protein [Deferribacteraceae bacterium]